MEFVQRQHPLIELHDDFMFHNIIFPNGVALGFGCDLQRVNTGSEGRQRYAQRNGIGIGNLFELRVGQMLIHFEDGDGAASSPKNNRGEKHLSIRGCLPYRRCCS